MDECALRRFTIDSEHFSGLVDEEGEIFIPAAICELREAVAGRHEGLVEVEEFQIRASDVFGGCGEYGGFKCGQRDEELGLYQREWLEGP